MSAQPETLDEAPAAAAPRLCFAKMHALGNDFLVVDDRDGTRHLTAERIRALADRRRGVGFDQLLVVRRAARPGPVAAMDIFNADGSAAGQCGNGLRCFARFLRTRGIAGDGPMAIDTPGGEVTATLLADGRVRVDMGRPDFEPAAVPFRADARAGAYELTVAGRRLVLGVVSMGNPHAVLEVDDVDAAPVAELGAAVQGLDRFPEGVNVGFMQVLGHDHIRLRVCERGVGETPACGSGACAAVAVGRDRGRLGPEVAVDLPGGRLQVSWAGGAEPLWMTGPAVDVYEGSLAE